MLWRMLNVDQLPVGCQTRMMAYKPPQDTYDDPTASYGKINASDTAAEII